MGNLHDLALLLILGAVVAAWMELARARELAVAAARRHCELQGLQLLDETVGLRSLRLRTVNGSRGIEHGYAFEVSIDGDDREPGRIWMQGRRVTGLSLPTVHWLAGVPANDNVHPDTTPPVPRQSPAGQPRANNVVPLRRRMPPGE
ncbi:DUF3301 domain-containing protein [Dyella lutea]|uniref:DUF3301 domain-containing protein n=1 Tax=Dyella lutea TaxID=2950441 RepID=A0ABT1F9Q9_9GAMM|nr:DUF3301 domain-containing protein [Dyella lutea]MCP1374110.1 DUF3301 domain-containing protein [Dyella lutea]